MYVCKLADGEQPLFLRLVAGPDTDTLSFVLREQQTGEVMVTLIHRFLLLLLLILPVSFLQFVPLLFFLLIFLLSFILLRLRKLKKKKKQMKG